MAKQNTKYKDSVFCDLFYTDIDAKKNLLELYNALFDENIRDESMIEKVRLEDVLFRNMKNDVAFMVKKRRIVLSEHQSTVNPNMPARMLMYISREYEAFIPVKARYSERRVMLPVPVFFVFYNGEKDQPAEEELRLSDSYYEEERGFSQLELKVKVININPNKHHELLKKSRILCQYSEFVERTRKYAGDPAALEKAVKDCIQDGILSGYLTRKGSEVVNMLMAEYDYDMDIAVHEDEAREEGRKEGKMEGNLGGKAEVYYSEMHLSAAEIADRLGISTRYVEKLLSEKGLLPDKL